MNHALKFIALCIIATCTACVVHVPPREGRFRRGEAWTANASASTVLLLPAECHGDADACERLGSGLKSALGARATLELEANGYAVMPADRVHIVQGELRVQIIEQASTNSSTGETDSSVAEHEERKNWVTWNDATPEGREAVTRMLNLGGILRPLVTLGGAHAAMTKLDVVLELRRPDRNEALIWRASCTAIGEAEIYSPLRADEAGVCAGVALAEFGR